MADTQNLPQEFPQHLVEQWFAAVNVGDVKVLKGLIALHGDELANAFNADSESALLVAAQFKDPIKRNQVLGFLADVYGISWDDIDAICEHAENQGWDHLVPDFAGPEDLARLTKKENLKADTRRRNQSLMTQLMQQVASKVKVNWKEVKPGAEPVDKENANPQMRDGMQLIKGRGPSR